MSGLVGVFNLDDHPVALSALTVMINSLSHWKHDKIDQCLMGPIGLGYLRFPTTPEMKREKQPLVCEKKRFCVTFDGRIDNRKELIQAIQGYGGVLRNDSDSEIILKAYMAWGEEFVLKIVGDFALTIWDGDRQQLYCARDYLGVKPFYYYYDKYQFLWGSDIHPFFTNEKFKKA